MNIEAIRTELEEEQTWRQNEIRFLRNQLSEISGYSRKKQYRKSLMVMLYSHYEGFCKFAMECYVKAVNGEGVTCDEATEALVAGAWAGVFTAVESGDKKARVFKNVLPSGDALHRLARRREFVERLPEFRSTIARIPDDTVDTESNLWPTVLQKNLYRLGLRHDAFAQQDGAILNLLNRRNNIAHGAQRDGVTAEKYSESERAVFRIMEDFMLLIVDALRKEEFKKAVPAGGP
ncbi:MAG: hypothetical protein HQ582_14450 [Planctomycetes bacterium]|nr:hypothetical protein [Planctomycetota bacterium]